MKCNQNGSRCMHSILVFAYLIISVIHGQQLDCSFDQKSFCSWSNGINGVEDDFDWQIDDSVAIDGFHSIPRTIEGSGFFTFAQGRFRPFESDAARAWLRSPTIEGTGRPATLSFVFWKTAVPPVLQVCTRDTGENRLRCLDTISGMGEQRWTQRVIVIPGNSSPFQIIFVATGFRTALDLVGVDDITFRFGESKSPAELARRPLFLDSAVGRNLQWQSESILGEEAVENRGEFVFPTPPVAFETYRPIYNRVQSPFDISNKQDSGYGNSYYNNAPVDNPYKSGIKVYERTPIAPTGRSEVYYVTETKKYETDHSSKETTDDSEPRDKRTMYTHTEPHFYFTTPPHAYTSTPPHAYTSTPPHAYTSTPPHAYTSTPHAYTSTTHVYTSTSKESPHFYITTPKSETETDQPEFGKPCAATNCYFDKNFCFWYNDLKANFDWKLKSAETSSRGIVSDSSERVSYVFISGESRKREQRAALRSPLLRIPNGSYLDFVCFLSDSSTGHLSLSSNDNYGNKLLWETFGYKSLGGHGWNRVRVALPDVNYPIILIFEVNQTATGQYIGVDDLRLTDRSGEDVECSFNSSMYGTTPHSYSIETETEKGSYDRRKTTTPVIHSAIFQNDFKTDVSPFRSDSRYINGEILVNVLGEHGGSILKPERIDAGLTTEDSSFYQNSEFYSKQSEYVFPVENNRQGRFQNLIDNSNSFGTGPKLSTIQHPAVNSKQTDAALDGRQSLETTIPQQQRTIDNAGDPLGVGDFVRRVSSDLTSLLGINRQSYIFGADVFNRFYRTSNDFRTNDNNDWFSHTFGKKK